MNVAIGSNNETVPHVLLNPSIQPNSSPVLGAGFVCVYICGELVFFLELYTQGMRKKADNRQSIHHNPCVHRNPRHTGGRPKSHLKLPAKQGQDMGPSQLTTGC